jgi:hypothetical protein
MDKFLDAFDLPKLNSEDNNHLDISNKQSDWNNNKECLNIEESKTRCIHWWILPDH